MDIQGNRHLSPLDYLIVDGSSTAWLGPDPPSPGKDRNPEVSAASFNWGACLGILVM